MGHTVHRSEGCQHPQTNALPAPTPRVMRNFGLTLESTYFLLVTVVSDFQTNFQTNVHMDDRTSLAYRELRQLDASYLRKGPRATPWKQQRSASLAWSWVNLSQWSFLVLSAWASKYRRHRQRMCSPLDKKKQKGYTVDRKDVGCREIAPQPYALLAPTPRAKRNFGLTSESTYFLLMTVVTDYRLLTNFQANVHIKT